MLDFECLYCGHQWTEKVFPGSPVRCCICRDKHVRVEKHDENKRNVFGYDKEDTNIGGDCRVDETRVSITRESTSAQQAVEPSEFRGDDLFDLTYYDSTEGAD